MAEILEKPIEIFYPGNHVDSQGKKVSVSRAEVEAMVADFNQSGGRVPLVPGHPSDDNPALGYATKLGLSNGRAIVTEVDELNPAFMAIVNSGELNRVSVKLQLPGHHANPGKGHRLKHIGFLGRSRPALDQLKSAQFSTDNGEIILMADDDKSAEFAEREAEFARREAELAAKEARFAAQAKYEPMVEGWVREGKIAPAQKAPLVALFCVLPEGDEATFAAADGSKQSLVEFTKSFVNGLPKQIEYAEISKAEGKKKTEASFKSYGSDDDDEPDSGEMELHDKIIAGGVDPKDHVAYTAALKKHMGGK
ncbi:MAG: hypothetical protein ACRCZS_08875 [Chroococcidiopsis sp.]